MIPARFGLTLAVVSALTACAGPEGKVGPAGPAGPRSDASPVLPDSSRDAAWPVELSPIPADLDPADLDPADLPTDSNQPPDASGLSLDASGIDPLDPCADRAWPPRFGGVASSVVDEETATRWLDYRASREADGFSEAADPSSAALRFRLPDLALDGACLSTDALVDLGRELFLRRFTAAEGFGPRTEANGLARLQSGPALGPDAARCADCHWKGGFAGGGDRADLAYLFGDGDDILTSEPRNAPALWGAGWVEALAAEMTSELHTQRDLALAQVDAQGAPVNARFETHGVEFGTYRVSRGLDGSAQVAVPPSGFIDADLVVRPFGWRGDFATLEDFVRDSFGRHFGLQASAGDADGDGVELELQDGQVNAVVAFIGTLDVPGIQVPDQAGVFLFGIPGLVDFVTTPEYTERFARGAALFVDLGCATCHIPFLRLRSPRLKVGSRLIDLETEGARPVADRDEDGQYLVPLFSDLKRHHMGEHLSARGNDVYLTRRLWGVAQTSPYLHDGSATTIDEAVAKHGGRDSEAIASALAFGAASDADRASVRVFLDALRRAPSLRVP